MTLGTWVDPLRGKTTLGAYAVTWLDTKIDVAERTRINIEGRLRHHSIPYLGNMALSSIQPSDIRHFVNYLSQAGLKPSTVAAYTARQARSSNKQWTTR